MVHIIEDGKFKIVKPTQYSKAIITRIPKHWDLVTLESITDQFERALFYLLNKKLDDVDMSKEKAVIIYDKIKNEKDKVDAFRKSSLVDKMWVGAYDNIPEDKLSKEEREKLSDEVIKLARSHFEKTN